MKNSWTDWDGTRDGNSVRGVKYTVNQLVWSRSSLSLHKATRDSIWSLDPVSTAQIGRQEKSANIFQSLFGFVVNANQVLR